MMSGFALSWRHQRLGALAIAVLTLLVLAPPAGAVVYWQTGHEQTSLINRANLDGSNAQIPFFDPANTLRIDDLEVHGGYIYWLLGEGGAGIGRARVDGTQVEPNFIQLDSSAAGIAVNSSGIFWTRFRFNTIARADLDGGNVNTNFITAAPPEESDYGMSDIVANETHLYWARPAGFSEQEIGRADTDGTDVNESFVSVPESSRIGGLALSDTHIHWADPDSYSNSAAIGRASLDGSEVNPSFIDNAVTGKDIFDIAVGGPYLYWADYQSMTVGRMGLDGSAPNTAFIRAPEASLSYVAADSLVIPNTDITKGPDKKTTKRKARIFFKSPNAPEASFQCAREDKENYKPCTNPAKFRVGRGRHKFYVRAVNATGVDPSPARIKWRVKKDK